jgi:TolB-like protein
MEDVKHAGLVFSLVVILCGCVSTPIEQESQNNYLASAIFEGSKYIISRVNRNSKIAVVNIQSPKINVSEYIIESLIMHLVNEDKFIIIERSEMDIIQREQDYQLSGAVSDETAVSIGKHLGTQFIITGSLLPIGDNYSLRLKITNVETAQIIGTQIYIVQLDNVLLSLLNSPDQDDEIADETKKQVYIDNVNITNNNTTTINGDVYVNMPGWFDQR